VSLVQFQLRPPILYEYILINVIKNFGRKIYKKIIIFFFYSIYGKVRFNKNTSQNYYNKKIKINNISYSIFKISDCRIYTDQVSNVAYIKDNFILTGPSIQFRHGVIKESSENVVLKSATTRFIRNIDGKILSILSGGAGTHNYWHWLFDVIPRILLFEKFYSLNEINKILVPSIKKKFQYQTLNILGIKIKQCIDAMVYRHIKVKELYATTHPNPSQKKVPYWIILLLKKKFLKNKFLKKNFNKFKKIYIDRSDSDSNVKDFRKIVNENLVKVFLIFKGFKIVRLSDYDFKEQVSIFYNARCVIGLHGAGFANMIFCKKNALVMEVKSNTTNNIIKNLAISNKLRYVNISLKPIAKPIGSQFGIVYLPLIKLNYFLRQYDI
jgi:hypothetical protein